MELSPCTYCQSLDLLDRSRRGAKTRCPLCKNELWRTAAATYRLPADGVVKGSSRSGVWIATGICLAALTGGAALWPATHHVVRTDAPSPTIPSPVAVVVAEPIAAPLAVVPKAAVKSSVNVVVGISAAKRTTLRPRSVAKRLDGNTAEFTTPVAATTIVDAKTPIWPTSSLPPAKSTVATTPEVVHVAIEPSFQGAADQLKKLAGEIELANLTAHDAYIRRQRAQRPDLQGLPFAMGGACKLGVDASKSLAKFSALTQNAIGANLRAGSRTAPSDYSDPSTLTTHVTRVSTVRSTSEPKTLPRDALPALEQILAPESGSYRHFVVDQFKSDDSPAATAFLKRRAVFEFDDEVRRAAVEALAKRKHSPVKDETIRKYVAKKYGKSLTEDDDLLAAFRHPWQRAAWHAAEAVVALKRTDLIEALEVIRTEPAPETPVERVVDGATRFENRELVRINHHKNCFLCHPPATKEQVDETIAARRDSSGVTVPVGLVPNPRDVLPAISGPIYYSRSRGSNPVFVRADITYLRQDFSLKMPVADKGLWPEMQRFDFFVRTNVLTEDKAKELPLLRIEDTEAGAAIRYAIAELRKLKS